MYRRVIQATHPDMMREADAAALAERYVVSDIFSADAVGLTYAHVERFVIGGAMPVEQALGLPAQVDKTPFLGRRELGIVNVGGAGRVTADGVSFELSPRDGLYLPMGTSDVRFESASPQE